MLPTPGEPRERGEEIVKRPQRRLPVALVAATIFLIPGEADAQSIDEAMIVVPRPTEELFVDPVRDVLDPRLASVDLRSAEISRERFDVRPAAAELASARADLTVGELEPEDSLFLDATSRANELTAVETVAAGATEIVLNRVARRVTYRELAATRRTRFGRPETVRPRPPFEPSRPFGPRPAE